jgi:hypothetical protein
MPARRSGVRGEHIEADAVTAMRCDLDARAERDGGRIGVAPWSRPMAFVALALVAQALVPLLLCGCSHASPAASLADDTQRIGSWLATLQLAAEAWGGNRVPAHYVHDTIDVAREAIERAAEAAQGSAIPAATRVPLRRLLAEAHVACRALDDAVTRGDRAAGSALAARFGALHERFAAWQQQAAGGAPAQP